MNYYKNDTSDKNYQWLCKETLPTPGPPTVPIRAEVTVPIVSSHPGTPTRAVDTGWTPTLTFRWRMHVLNVYGSSTNHVSFVFLHRTVHTMINFV